MKIKFKKSFIPVIVLIGSLGAVLGAYVLFFSSGSTGLIIQGGGEIEFADTFELAMINSSADSYEHTQWINVSNLDGNRTAFVTFTEDIIDVEDDCSNEGDVTFEIEYGMAILDSGDSIVIGSGDSMIAVKTRATPWSCPQEASISLEISE